MAYGAHVQSVGKSSPGLGDTQAYPGNNTAGNTLVTTLWGVNDDTYTVSDSQGNTWARAHVFKDVTTADVWVCLSCAAGANTVTFTADVNDDHYWQIYEFEGASTLGPVTDGTGAASPITCAALVTTSAPALILLAGATASNRSFTAGGSLTILLTTIGPPGRLVTGSQVEGATGSFTPSVTMSNNEWSAVGIALYEAGGAGPASHTSCLLGVGL